MNSHLTINNQWIVSNRGIKNKVDSQKPYAWLVEKERTSSGKIEDVAIVFLTNQECPFKCLMCDLWKNTTNKPVSVGDIPTQIEWALAQMPKVKHIKLYNSGNFFDEKAIPEKDYPRMASLLKDFETVIVENHTKLINEKCLRFRDLIKPRLEIAVGLETIHPEVLPKLNKQMTLDDFSNAINYLNSNHIKSRAFILLKPPFLTEEEGVFWAKKTIDFAFEAGVDNCTVIPVRVGNGTMEILQKNGDFSPPTINSLETVLDYGISLNKGRVFADTWDLQLFSCCNKCINQRTSRLTSMNHSQSIASRVACICDSTKPRNPLRKVSRL